MGMAQRHGDIAVLTKNAMAGNGPLGRNPRNSGGDPGLYCSYLNNPLGMALGGYGRVSARSPELR